MPAVTSPIVITPYDPAWPETFHQLRGRLAKALGELAIDILHVGSTAVPGLAAKPIIDIDIVIEGDGHLPPAIKALAIIGYEFEGDLGVSGRYAFKSPAFSPDHHLYVCAQDNPELRRHIAFRDHLRHNPNDAAAYAALKYAAARQYGRDRVGYTDAKHEWVEQALKRARCHIPDEEGEGVG